MDHNTLNKPVVTRFAPSPTGFMHIGGVRTALFAYLFARKHNGKFILRIEDTDKDREVAGSIDHIQESLTWLGINWDFGPNNPGEFGSCIQSERLPVYLKYAKELEAKGLAYADPYTPEEVSAFREQAKVENRPFLFRDHRPETFLPWDGTRPLRLKVPEIKRYTWQDATRGELSAGEEMLDDFILIKSDGYPTYNLAHIIDDHEMGVTHIMRADEFISSMPKFLSLYDALGFTYPTFVTLPPILRDDRTKKLGKRDGAKDILEYRAEGFLPEAMVNFLALIGWNPGTDQEIFSMSELIEAFDISKIQRAGGAFNEEKAFVDE
ncbi:MAG: glutamate--tRNA ligase [Candidatus Paceibacterota bacterium]